MLIPLTLTRHMVGFCKFMKVVQIFTKLVYQLCVVYLNQPYLCTALIIIYFDINMQCICLHSVNSSDLTVACSVDL